MNAPVQKGVAGRGQGRGAVGQGMGLRTWEARGCLDLPTRSRAPMVVGCTRRQSFEIACLFRACRGRPKHNFDAQWEKNQKKRGDGTVGEMVSPSFEDWARIVHCLFFFIPAGSEAPGRAGLSQKARGVQHRRSPDRRQTRRLALCGTVKSTFT